MSDFIPTTHPLRPPYAGVSGTLRSKRWTWSFDWFIFLVVDKFLTPDQCPDRAHAQQNLVSSAAIMQIFVDNVPTLPDTETSYDD